MPGSEPDRSRSLLAAVLEARSFFGPVTLLVGPRLRAFLPGARSSAIRMKMSAAAGFGAARDALGDASVTVVSGGLGLAVMGGRGAFRYELGPMIEMGWTWVHGVPKGSFVHGSTVGAAFGAAAAAASLFVEIAPSWNVLAGLDVGFAFSGIDARADTRPVAHTAGPMLGASAGVAYAF
ncbi:MAG: hypothetical protein JOZ69_04520 [Myxococcales bacterium]|nr:hypothetical protein [Myxococcales bacterium]